MSGPAAYIGAGSGRDGRYRDGRVVVADAEEWSTLK